MTDATPEQLALARKIAEQTVSEDADNFVIQFYAARDAALAAIIEATERAAKYVDEQANKWRRYPSLLNEAWNEQDALRALECDRNATALRNQEHLKND